MLKCEIIGHVGQNAELKVLDNGRTAIQFSVAHSEKYNNHEGQPVEKTTWVNCTIFRGKDQSTKIADYLLKGTQVFCEGKPDANAWTGQDGNIRSGLRLVVAKVELLGSKTQQSNEQAAQPATRQAAPQAARPAPQGGANALPDDDLPF